MADPITLRRPPAGSRYDPNALDAKGQAVGDLLGVVSDGAGGFRSAWKTPSDIGVDPGVATGIPGNAPMTLVAGAPAVVFNIGATLREPKIAKRSRFYRTAAASSKARLQGNVWQAASEGTEIHLVYFDLFENPIETGVFMRFDRENYPEPGGYLDIAEGALAENTRFGWAVKGGDGTTVGKVSNLYVDFVSSATPPDSPTGDAPFTTLFDALYLSDVDVYADTTLTTPQTTNAGLVAGWKNQITANTVHGEQSGSGNRPLLDTGTTLGGFQSIKFIGGASGKSLFFFGLLTGTSAGTLYLVTRKALATGEGALWSFGGNGSQVTFYGDPDGIIRDSALAVAPRHVTADPVASLTVGHVYTVASKAGRWRNWVNDELLVDESGTYQAGAGGDGVIGINGSLDGYSGWVWLLAWVAGEQTDDEIQAARDAIYARYGITP